MTKWTLEELKEDNCEWDDMTAHVYEHEDFLEVLHLVENGCNVAAGVMLQDILNECWEWRLEKINS